MNSIQTITQEQDANATPSTASRVRPVALENSFPTPTPPKRQPSRASEPAHSGRRSPNLNKLIHFGKASPAAREHKSVEALRSNVSRADGTGLLSTYGLERAWQRRDLSKKSSLYFEQVFATREPYHSAKQKVTRDSPIVLELLYNGHYASDKKLADSDTDAINLSQVVLHDFLMSASETYNKPPSQIMIAAHCNAQMIVAGSTDSAYILTVSALSSEVAAIKNLRATQRLQTFLNENLGIAPHRGIVKFVALGEAEFAINGNTMQAEMEKIDSEQKRFGSLRSRQHKRSDKKSTIPTVSEGCSHILEERSDTPILLTDQRESEEQPYQSESSVNRIVKPRKSIMHFWKRSNSQRE